MPKFGREADKRPELRSHEYLLSRPTYSGSAKRCARIFYIDTVIEKRRRYQNGSLEKVKTSHGPCWYIRFTNPDGTRLESESARKETIQLEHWPAEPLNICSWLLLNRTWGNMRLVKKTGNTPWASRRTWAIGTRSLNCHAVGVPDGIRTRVTAVKGRCPGPLDDGDAHR